MASVRIQLTQQLSDGRKSVSRLDFPRTGHNIYAISCGDHSSHGLRGTEWLVLNALQESPVPSHGQAALCKLIAISMRLGC